jgi:hypothetical protein
MIEVMGGDVINFTTLIHKGYPLICGFDGVDYAGLRTIINHKSQKVDGLINRLTAWSDPYNVWLFSDFDPGKSSTLSLMTNISPFRRLFTLKDGGRATESIGFWETIFGNFNPFEIKP